MQVEIDINDLADPAIAQLASQCADLSPAFKDFGEFYMDKLDRQFRSESDPYNSGWSPLAASCLARKLKLGRIPKILQSRGHMRARTSYAVSPMAISIGFNDAKAKWHDRGTSKLPQRQLLPDGRRGLSSDAASELQKSIADYLFSP